MLGLRYSIIQAGMGPFGTLVEERRQNPEVARGLRAASAEPRTWPTPWSS